MKETRKLTEQTKKELVPLMGKKKYISTRFM
jgi:hypothetical protein